MEMYHFIGLYVFYQTTQYIINYSKNHMNIVKIDEKKKKPKSYAIIKKTMY